MNNISGMGRRLILFALIFSSTYAHSWIDELKVIASNGTFIGAPGYPRGYVSRSDPGFSDTSMTYLLPSDGKPKFTDADLLCMDTQRKKVQKDGYPRLEASAGAAVALRFQENGHVTMPETQKGKPKNRGTIYVYGTTNPKTDEKLLDVHKKWTRDGTGGDKRGVLLGQRDYDDGRCYQVNGGEISTTRQKKFPHEADQLMGADLWCQSDIAIPDSAPSGKPYTLYWVWDWPTEAGVDPGLPDGKPELYTTCMDVDIVDGATSQKSTKPKYDDDQSLNAASIPKQFKQIHASQPEPAGTSTAASTPTKNDPSSPVTVAPTKTSTGSPVATVTFTAVVTFVTTVSPTGSA